MFEPKLISSQIYRDWPLHFDPLLPQVVTDVQGEKRALDTGVKILPNGDVSFRVYAPGSEIYLAGKQSLSAGSAQGYGGLFHWNPSL